MIVDAVTQAARAHFMFAACKLDLPELLAGGPRSSDEIARETRARGDLHRLMRGLVACGVLEQDEAGRFALTEDGNALRADTANSARTLVMEWREVIAGAMAALAHGAMTGETPFDHVFGMSVWEYRALDSVAPSATAWQLSDSTANAGPLRQMHGRVLAASRDIVDEECRGRVST